MNQQQYIDYLENIYIQANGKHLAPSTVNHYGKEAMRKIQEQLKLYHGPNFNIYEVTDLADLKALRDELFSIPYFKQLNKDGNNMYSAGMNRYVQYAEGILFRGKEDLLPLLDHPTPIVDTPIISVREKLRKQVNLYPRKGILIQQTEQACNYKCQLDSTHHTFIVDKANHEFMEGHHIIPLAKQKYFEFSLDCYANILVVCPNCHRFLHYGNQQSRHNELTKIYREREERYVNSGIKIDLKDFLELTDRTPSNKIISYAE